MEALELGEEEWANVALCLLSVFGGDDTCLEQGDLESNCHVSKLGCLWCQGSIR